jgi:hypothetical protein
MPLIAALLAVAVPAQSGWITLFDEPGESTSFRIVDRRPGASEAFVWVRHVYPRPRAGGVKAMNDQWLVSCPQRSFTIYALVSYDSAGRIISAQPVPAAERRAAPVIRGSRMEKVFTAVCG